jgi:integrase
VESQEVAWHRALRKACERAQLPHTSTNDLRRTFCTWCYHAGVSEHTLQGWMGHASNRMIREVYAQPSDVHGRDQIARLPAANLPRISHNHGQIGAI